MRFFQYEIYSPVKSTEPDTIAADDMMMSQSDCIIQAEMPALLHFEYEHDTRQHEYAMLSATYDRFFNKQ